ncbi:MAG: hypothetical protein GEU28_09490 [Dehalococcoidia bacterium]|nr:hypothetical protein [Dehalococcoidia bacterium]
MAALGLAGIALLLTLSPFQDKDDPDGGTLLSDLLQKAEAATLAVPPGSVVHTVARHDNFAEINDSARPDPYHLPPGSLQERQWTVESWSAAGDDGFATSNYLVARDSEGLVVQEALEDANSAVLYDGVLGIVSEFEPSGRLSLGIDLAELAAREDAEDLGRDEQAGMVTQLFRLGNPDSGTFTEIEVSIDDGFVLRRTTLEASGDGEPTIKEEFAVQTIEILEEAEIPTELQFASQGTDLSSFQLPQLRQLTIEEAAQERGGFWLLGEEALAEHSLAAPEVAVIGPETALSSVASQVLGPFPAVQVGAAYQVDYRSDGDVHVGLFQGEAEKFVEVLTHALPIWDTSEQADLTVAGERPSDAWLVRSTTQTRESELQQHGVLIRLESDLLMVMTQGLSEDEAIQVASSLVRG